MVFFYRNLSVRNNSPQKTCRKNIKSKLLKFLFNLRFRHPKKMMQNILSQRCKRKLINKGFLCVVDRYNSDKKIQFWLYEQILIYKARIHVDEEGAVLKEVNMHSHKSDDALVKWN